MPMAVKRNQAQIRHLPSEASFLRNIFVTRSRFIVLLIPANAIILAGAYYYWDSTHLPGTIPTTVFITNEVPTVVASTNEPVTNTPSVVMVTNQFRWRQLESKDYRTYIAN